MTTERPSDALLRWGDFMPQAAQAKQDTVAILQEARRHPQLIRQCFEHGWDGRRGLVEARKVVKKALPVLENMRRRGLESTQASTAAATTTTDLSRSIPYPDAIQRLRKGRQESTKLRAAERRSKKEAARLEADRAKMVQARDECQRLVDGFDQALAKHKAVMDKCSRDASTLEQDQAVVKQGLNAQTVALFRDFAGIDLAQSQSTPGTDAGADGEASDAGSSNSGGGGGGDQEAQIDANACNQGRLGGQRPVTRTAMRAQLHTYGSFDDSPDLSRHVLERLGGSRGSSPSHPLLSSPVTDTVHLPDPGIDSSIDQARRRRQERHRTRLADSGKQPRQDYLPDDWRVGVWENLREVVRYHREDADIPELWLEPDGQPPLDSCWWNRFTGFWEDHARQPFDHRDHQRAQQFLHEWEELVRDVEASPAALLRSRDPSFVAGGDGDPADSAGTSDSDDGELDRISAKVASSTQAVAAQLQVLLEYGAFEGDDAASRIAREFLAAPTDRGDLRQVSEILDRVQLTPSGPPPVAESPVLILESGGDHTPPAEENQEEPKAGEPAAASTTEPLTVPVPEHPETTPEKNTNSKPKKSRRTRGSSRPRRPPHHHQQGWLSAWSKVLAEAQQAGHLSLADQKALIGVAQRYASLVTQNPAPGRGRSNMGRYTYGSNRLGYVKNFLVDTHNEGYLRRHPEREAGRGGPEGATLDARLERYRRFHELMTRMCKMLSTGRMKPVNAPNKALDLSANYVHRDLWVADWRLCTLQEALTPGGPEQFNVAKPWNYTMGGWACIRCTRPLAIKDGDCRCRCFRGHTRRQCARADSGCYGFHPNRFMEFIALGLPRNRVEYMQQHMAREAQQRRLQEEEREEGGEEPGEPGDTTAEPMTTTPAYSPQEVQQLVEQWMLQQREEFKVMQDEDQEISPEVEAQHRATATEYYRNMTQEDLDDAARGAKRRKTKAPERSMQKRRWDFRQRWRFFRKIMKEIAKGYEVWFGVVPESERGVEFDGIVDDMAPLLQDWFERLDAPRLPLPPSQTCIPKTPADRCRWLAKFHLDLLLDPTKYDPERRKQYPPNHGGPSWHWICDHCPLCGMTMDSNKNNTCRGLCDGCRAWIPIVGPEGRLIAAGEPYSVFGRDPLSRGKHANKKRKRRRTRAKTHKPSRIQTPASVSAPSPPSPPRKRTRLTLVPSATHIPQSRRRIGLGATLLLLDWGNLGKKRPRGSAVAPDTKVPSQIQSLPPPPCKRSRCVRQAGSALSLALMMGGGSSSRSYKKP